MPFPTRITGPLLRVLDVFVRASEEDEELHGWAIKKSAKLSGASTYKMMDHLEDAGWIEGRWEANPQVGKPQRRFYTLTPKGEPAARAILAERWPEALRRDASPGRGTGPAHLPEPNPLSCFLGTLGRTGRRSPGEAR